MSAALPVAGPTETRSWLRAMLRPRRPRVLLALVVLSLASVAGLALPATLGRIVVELNPTVAPATTVNFLRYVHSGFYNNTLFHGVVAGSLVQGGYLNTTPAQQLGVLAPIALETNRGLSNVRGTLALSRKARADTATSQFYFNLADNPQLDYASPERPGYAVFGRVVQGLEVLDAIGQVPTNLLYGLPHFPVSDVVITSAVQIQ